jgi:hypothetical protein
MKKIWQPLDRRIVWTIGYGFRNTYEDWKKAQDAAEKRERAAASNDPM